MIRIWTIIILLFIFFNGLSQNVDKALKYYNKGQYKEAAFEFEKALPNIEKEFGKNDTSFYSYILVLTANSFDQIGELSKAAVYYFNAIKIYETINAYNSLFYIDILNKLTGIYQDIGDYEKLEPLYVKILKNYRKRQTQPYPDYANLLYNLASLYHNVGNYEKAEPLYLELLEIDKKTIGEKHSDYLINLNNLSLLYLSMSKYEKAENILLEIIDIHLDIIGQKNLTYAIFINNLATVYKSMKEYDKAEQLLLEVLEIRKEILGEKHPDYLSSFNNIAELYLIKEQIKKDEALLIKTKENDKDTLGDKHLFDIDLAMKYFNAKQYKEAANEFEYGLPEVEKLFSINDTQSFSKILIYTAVSFDRSNQQNEAEKYYLKAKEIYESLNALNSNNYFIILSNLTLLYKNLHLYDKAELLCIRLIDIKKKYLGTNDLSYAKSILLLAEIYQDIGQFKKAEYLFIEVIQTRINLLGEFHSSVANAYNNLASLEYDMGDYKKAEENYYHAYQINKKVLDKDHPDFATSINNLAFIYSQSKKYKKAELLYNDALEIQLNLFGDSNLSYANTLDNLAVLYKETDSFIKAELLFIKALKIKLQILGDKHSSYALTLNNLALLYLSMCHFEKSEELFFKTLQINKLTYGENHQEYATTLSNLSSLYRETGNIEKAEKYGLLALNIDINFYGNSHPQVALDMNNLAGIYDVLGNKVKSISLNLRAAEIRKNVFGENHPIYAESLNNLSASYIHLGFYSMAEPLAVKAFNIAKKHYGKESLFCSTALNNLAVIYLNLGKYKESAQYSIEAVDIKKEILGEEHLDFAVSLNNLAIAYLYLGDFNKAESIFKQAADIQLKTIGSNNLQYYRSISNLTLFYVYEGRLDKAEQLFINGFEILQNQIESQFLFLSEIEKEIFLKTVSFNLESHRSLYLLRKEGNPRISINAYNLELVTKGMILSSSVNLRQDILQNGGEQILELFDQWISYKNILSKQYSKPNKERIIDLKDFEEKANELEKELTSESNIFRKASISTRIEWNEIKQALKPDEAAIEFSSFQYYNGKKWTDSVVYVALIIRKDDKYPVMVQLFEEITLDSLLNKKGEIDESFISALYRGAHVTSSKNQSDKGTELFNLIWEPIDSFLLDIKTVYYSPSGLLNQISFAAVPYKDSIMLSDRFNLIQLSSTAKLVNIKKDKSFLPKTIALIGGIDYAMDVNEMLEYATKQNINNDTIRLATRSLPSDIQRSGSWQYLPGTLNEVQLIEEIAKKNKIVTTIYTDKTANEESFKTLSGSSSPEVIHIATHGFFFPDPKKDYSKISKGFQDESSIVFKSSDNPLMRSGLLFAGANHSWMGEQVPDNIDDGILAAYEISNLYHPNTKLVVLSACETGLGEIKGSEGVYGLQRAFKMAGVEYIIMSLWKVPDAETVEFMETFYEKWFSGTTIEEAFRYAQHNMKNKYPDQPYKWAAFVLIR